MTPNALQIETIAACNASCGFCPYTARKQMTVKSMPLEHIQRLVDEAATFPSLGQFIPFLTNEPFADARMPEIIALGNQKLPSSQVTIFTNGSLFHERTVARLADNNCRIDQMFFSLHHSTAAEYEAELKIDFEKTLTSIRRAIDAQVANKFTLLRVGNYDEAANARFQAFCGNLFPGIPVMIAYRYNWKGDVDPLRPYESTLDHICPRQTSMCILADGRVALCCMDQDGDHSLGDTRTHSMREIYNSPQAVRYRTRTKRENAPCSTCNMM